MRAARPARLTALALLAFAAPAGAQSIDAEIEQLAERVERLEGARAVRKLQRAFGFYVNRGLWGEAADLFADDGTIEIGGDGVYRGKDRVREYLRRLHGGQEGLIYGQLNERITLQPAIHVAPGRQFNAIVIEGLYLDKGMASFADLLKPEEVEAIHAYLIARANEDWGRSE